MSTRILQLSNKLGLHARAAAKFTHTAGRFQAQLQISYRGQSVNGKSILGVMMLAVPCGGELELVATGEDAEAMLEQLTQLIEQRFGEPH